MSQPSRSRGRDFLTGATAGALAGLVAKELDLAYLISYWGEQSPVVVAAALAGGILALTPLRRLVYLGVAGLAALWLTVAFTPLTHWLGRDLPRVDPLEKAEVVFVLASAMQPDGDFTTQSMSRLLHALSLLGEGWADALILSESMETDGRYQRAARELMDELGLSQEILVVSPAWNTRQEAVAVARLCQDRGFERLIVVTSPSHSRRAAAALEANGVKVISSPSTQTDFDYENLNELFAGDHHVRSFGIIMHELVGLLYYRAKGWIS